MVKILRNKWWAVLGLCLVFALSYANAFAWGERRSHEVVMIGHQRYHYHDGRFYRPGWFGLEFAIAVPPAGAVVSILPLGYRTIIVAGAPYYYCNNVYYRPYLSGYIVVPAPVVSPDVAYAPAVQPQTSTGETITINVPNSNGSYTPVTLVKHKDGYIGPQGEYYPGHPSVDQLKALYGK